ncbi:hypothetical protein ACQJBY_029166 [Aegilops geniculata]
MRMARLFFTRYRTHRLSAARLLASTSAQFAQRTEHLSRLPDPLHNVVSPPPPPPGIASQPPGFASAPPPIASPPSELPPRRRWESPPPVPGVASARPAMAQTRVGKRRDGRMNITITHHQRWLYAERVLDLWLIQVDVSLCYNLKKWRTRKSKLIYCLYKTRVNWIAAGRVL